MMVTIKCPKCTTEGKMSLVDPNYNGPYKCWSCRDLFTLKIENDMVVSCEPLSQEEYDRLYAPKTNELDAMRNKFRLGGR